MSIDSAKVDLSATIQSISEKMAQAIVDSLSQEAFLLVTKEAQKKRAQLEQASHLRLFADKIGRGFETILPVFEALSPFEAENFPPDVIESIHKLSQGLPELQDRAIASIMDYEQTKSIQELLDIADSTKLALYRVAVEIYNLGRYQDAASAFSIITLLDPLFYDAWLAQGCSEYHCQNYNSALTAFAMAVQADPSKPQTHFHAAHCFEALKQIDFALNSLELALSVIEENPEYLELVPNAEEHKKQLLELASKEE